MSIAGSPNDVNTFGDPVGGADAVPAFRADPVSPGCSFPPSMHRGAAHRHWPADHVRRSFQGEL